MRLTCTLLGRRKLGFTYKLKWKVVSQKKIIESKIPKSLLEKGVKIVDANEAVLDEAELKIKEQLSKVEMPEPYLFKKLTGEDHPSWKPRTCHIFNSNTRLLEGQEQAQILTNTVIRQGLPKRIDDLMDKTPALNDRDKILKRYILQSTVWDGVQKLLPKRIDMARPGHVFAREYGIAKARQINTLSYNLLRLLDNQVAFLEDSSNRSVFRNCHAIASSEKDGDLIKFHFKADLIIAGCTPLRPFADVEEVRRESATELPNLYPIKHTIDLKKTNIYELDNFFPLHQNVAQPYVQTLYIHHNYPYPLWLPRHVIGKALSTTYAFAVAQAKRNIDNVEGKSGGQLEKPISMQCVVTDGREFTLLAFQLNTLDLNGRDGIRNMAWLETGHRLYNESKEIDGKLCFEGYNSKVVDRLAAMHLNGIDWTRYRIPLQISPTPSEISGTTAQTNHVQN